MAILNVSRTMAVLQESILTIITNAKFAKLTIAMYAILKRGIRNASNAVKDSNGSIKNARSPAHYLMKNGMQRMESA